MRERLKHGCCADADLSVYEPRLLYIVLDIVSLSDILVTVVPATWPATRSLHFALIRHGEVFRLLRVVNWFRIGAEEEAKLLFVAGVSTHAMQFVQLILRMFMCMHLTGCMMFAMAQYQCDGWVRSNRTDPSILGACVERGDIGFLDDPNIFAQVRTTLHPASAVRY